MARKLWRRRLGVLIRDVDLSSGRDLTADEEGADLYSSVKRVEEIEAKADASDGEFNRESDDDGDEVEVEMGTAMGVAHYALYLLRHSHSGRTMRV